MLLALLHFPPYPVRQWSQQGSPVIWVYWRHPGSDRIGSGLGADNGWSSSCVCWQRASHLSLFIAPRVGSWSPGAVVQLQSCMSNSNLGNLHTFSVSYLPNVPAFECALVAFKKSKIVQLLHLLIIRVCILTHWSYRLVTPFSCSSACTFVIWAVKCTWSDMFFRN